MEGVDEVAFSFGLIKFGVGWVRVLDFKQEVRHRDRRVRVSAPPHPHLPLLRASGRPRLQQWAFPPRRLPGWPGLQLHPEAAEQGPLLLR